MRLRLVRTIDEVRLRFHAPFQFYGNMAITLLALDLAMAINGWPIDATTVFAICLGYVFLFSAQYSADRGAYDRPVRVPDRLVACLEK